MKNINIYKIIVITSLLAGPLFGNIASAQSNNVFTVWEGDGSAQNPYLIKTAEDLLYFSKCTNAGLDLDDIFFKQVNDIDMSSVCGEGNNWIPIGWEHNTCFSGYYDGGGYKIMNLYIDSPEENGLALFGTIKDGSLSNLVIDASCVIKGNSWVGGPVAITHGNSSVSNIINYADVYGVSAVGGIIGYLGDDSSLSNCTNYGKISIYPGHSGLGIWHGGVVGYANSGVISNCHNHGVISSHAERVGGLIGWANGNEQECKGLVLNVINCSNSATVSASGKCVGGIAGQIGSDTYEKKAYIYGCTNSGSVSSSAGVWVGDIVGYICDGKGAILDAPTTSRFVSYNLNTSHSGTGKPADMSGLTSYTVGDISGDRMFEEGNEKYSFVYWNTKADGTGECYMPGSTICPISGDVVLYAIWKKGYQIRYNLAEYLTGDDFTSFALPTDGTWYPTGNKAEAMFPDEVLPFSCEKGVFGFWSTNPDGSGDRYMPGDLIPISSDMTVYANLSESLLKIVREGLKAGESAIYDITKDSSTSPIMTVCLTGKENVSIVETTIVKIGPGTYTVKETSWSWAYNLENQPTVTPSAAGQSSGSNWVSSPVGYSQTLIFTFSGTEKEDATKHSENSAVNSF